MIGILILQHNLGISDKQTITRWVENPYWQYFCGYDYLQWTFPVHPSSLSMWRKCLGEKGIKKVLQIMLKLDLNRRVVEKSSL